MTDPANAASTLGTSYLITTPGWAAHASMKYTAHEAMPTAHAALARRVRRCSVCSAEITFRRVAAPYMAATARTSDNTRTRERLASISAVSVACAEARVNKLTRF